MATSFPQQIQRFPQMLDITRVDSALVKQYQTAMETGDISGAQTILAQIPNNQSKIITADYLNTLNDTVVAVEQFFQKRYSPAYVVSEIAPLQNATDFWFEVTG